MDENETPEGAAERHARAPEQVVPHLVIGFTTDDTGNTKTAHAFELHVRRDRADVAARVLVDLHDVQFARVVELLPKAG